MNNVVTKLTKLTDIEWDADDKEDLEFLPEEVIVPEEIIGEALEERRDNDEYAEYLSDWLTEEYGFCHRGATIE